MSHITANLYRAVREVPEGYTAHIPRREPTPGERWYTEQCELGKRAAEQIKRRMGWGRCGKFPDEALEAE